MGFQVVGSIGVGFIPLSRHRPICHWGCPLGVPIGGARHICWDIPTDSRVTPMVGGYRSGIWQVARRNRVAPFSVYPPDFAGDVTADVLHEAGKGAGVLRRQQQMVVVAHEAHAKELHFIAFQRTSEGADDCRVGSGRRTQQVATVDTAETGANRCRNRCHTNLRAHAYGVEPVPSTTFCCWVTGFSGICGRLASAVPDVHENVRAYQRCCELP